MIITQPRRFLIDVDGPVANLMAGFEVFFWQKTGEGLRSDLITTHRMIHSANHVELNARFDLDFYLSAFLSLPNVYQEYVPMTEGASEAIHSLIDRGHEIGFVTATMKTAPLSYVSKLKWLNDHFPGVPMLAVSAEQKCWVTGDYGIDDRYDTCHRWEQHGVHPVLFRMPWNEAPPGTQSYDWKEIIRDFGH